MKRKILISLILLCFPFSSCSKIEQQFQNDADLIRLEHLQYWTGLVEEYHQKTGEYPFQEKLKSNSEIGLVKIDTKQQRQYLSKQILLEFGNHKSPIFPMRQSAAPYPVFGFLCQTGSDRIQFHISYTGQ